MATTPQEALVAFLSADTAIAALIGTRLYPETAPEGEPYPRLTYQLIDWPTLNTLEGPTGYGRPRLQIDCWAKGPTSYADAWALANAVRSSKGGNGSGPALDGFHGLLSGMDIRRIRLVDMADQWDPPVFGEETPVRRVRLDFVMELVES